jgi:hypothetical protein
MRLYFTYYQIPELAAFGKPQRCALVGAAANIVRRKRPVASALPVLLGTLIAAITLLAGRHLENRVLGTVLDPPAIHFLERSLVWPVARVALGFAVGGFVGRQIYLWYLRNALRQLMASGDDSVGDHSRGSQR